MVDGLYWETWYNNQSVSQDELGYIFYENKLLGVPRMRQLKVNPSLLNVQLLVNIDNTMKLQLIITNCTGSQRFVHGSRRFPEHHQRMFRLLRKQHRRPDLLRTLCHLQLVWVCIAFAVALFSKKTTVYLRACVLQMGLPNRG